MPTTENQPEPNAAKLTPKQLRFVEEYCVDWNGTQAAIRAGYAKPAAYATAAENLRKPQIKSAIEERLNDLSLTAGQVTKLISEIAETRLNDFLTVEMVEEETKIPQPLAEAIQKLEQEIEFDEEYAVRSADVLGLLDEEREDYLDSKQGAIRRKRLDILKYEMMLERDASSFILIPGPPRLVERVDLDLVKLAKAKEGNRLKSWVSTEHGTKVEMYDSLAAARDMGRVRGIFEKDNTQAAAVPVINAKVEIIATGKPIARSEKDVTDV